MDNVLAAIGSYYRKCMRQQMKGLLKPGGSVAAKCYVCQRYPNFRTGKVLFRNGCYVTNDPEHQTLIEGHRYYGRHIFGFEVDL